MTIIDISELRREINQAKRDYGTLDLVEIKMEHDIMIGHILNYLERMEGKMKDLEKEVDALEWREY